MINRILKEVLIIILIVALGFAVSQIITKFVILKVKVLTGSMENTIMIDDSIVAIRLSYMFHNPKRGDIVVFPYPDNEKVNYIKRIIGLPGETIEGKDGYVYINDVPFIEPYVTDLLESDFGPYKIPDKCYFMMGDNRNNSEDSRYWDNKFVNREKIKGKAFFKFPDFAWLNNNDIQMEATDEK